jgi:uncharacterized protein
MVGRLSLPLLRYAPPPIALSTSPTVMLFLLSPAKSLDYASPATTKAHSVPLFADRAEVLIGLLREKSPPQIAELMHLSDALATLNVARYGAWSPRFTARNSKQAVLAFNGDVYDGLDARSLGAKDLAWAQDHVVILSGLYGVLRPLDRMQPYRLEMGTRLANPQGKDLYAYWGARIAQHLNERLADSRSPVVVNLASEEYFKAVDLKTLSARVVQCVFEDWKDGRYKIISFFAKRARGLMARHAVLKRVRTVKALQAFAEDGYALATEVSTPYRLVFRRRVAG